MTTQTSSPVTADDLVERLRRHAMIVEEVGCQSGIGRKIVHMNMLEAADEIAILKARADLAVQNRNHWQAEAERLRGVAAGSRTPAQRVTDEEPRTITDMDREYASELLADLKSGDLPRHEIAARWFRKARIENSLGRPVAQCARADIAKAIAYDLENGSAHGARVVTTPHLDNYHVTGHVNLLALADAVLALSSTVQTPTENKDGGAL